MKTNFKNLGRHGLSLLLAPCLLALFVCSSTAMAEGCCDLIPAKVTFKNGKVESGFFLAYVCGIAGSDITRTAAPKNSGPAANPPFGLDQSYLTQTTPPKGQTHPYLSIGHRSFASMKYSHQTLTLTDKDGTTWTVRDPQCSFQFFLKLPGPNSFPTKSESMYLKIPDFKSVVRTGDTIEQEQDD